MTGTLRDPRREGVAPLLRHAVRKQALALAGEVLLTALAAGVAVLAALHACGGSAGVLPGRAVAAGLALLGALLGGAAVYLERRVPPGVLARRVDRGLGLDGALVTALERSGQGPLTALLERRLRERVRARDVRRVVETRTLPFLALLLAACVALAASREGAGGPSAGTGVLEALAGLDADLQEAVERAFEARSEGRMTSEELERLMEERAARRATAADGASGAAGPPDAARLRDLRARLGDLADDLAHCPEVARALERSALRVDGALLGAAGPQGDRARDPAEGAGARVDAPGEPAADGAGGAPPAGGAPGARGGTGGRPDPAAPGGAGGPGQEAPAPSPAAGGGFPGVAPEPADGTMSRSPEPGEGPAGASEAASSPARRPVQVGGPFWSAAEAPLLERWLDARRRRLEGSGSPTDPRRSD